MKKIVVHFMGISGSGCSGAAALAQAQGFGISGCDINLDREELSRVFRSPQLFSGHNPNHLKGVDFLVVSPAVNYLDPKNEEIQEARAKGIKILTWQEFVGRFLLRNRFEIAVCGTHGKSTTTGILGFVLEQAGFDPQVLVGARVLNWGRNFRIGKSKYFVIEADEYNNNFLNYHPDVIAIANIEWDHPDFFKNEKKLYQSFKRFIEGAKKPLSIFFLPDEVGITKFLGFFPDKKEARKFIKCEEIKKLKLNIPGGFNTKNANLAYAVAKSLGVEDKTIRKALKDFKGVSRRFELVGEIGKTKIFDDFAHHPREIKATLKMARKIFPNRKIWVCFQPHTFSRTKTYFGDFVKVLNSAPVDQILLLDIFAAREKDKKIVSSQKLAEATQAPKVQYIGNLSEALGFLRKNKDKSDILINMGAGDIYKLSHMLLSKQ